MSRRLTFLISFLIMIFFFIVTAFIFPRDLYGGFLSASYRYQHSEALHPLHDFTELIPQQQIYTEALMGLSPWAVLSPWLILFPLTLMEDFGGLFVLLTIFPIVALILLLLYSWTTYLFIRSIKIGTPRLNRLNVVLVLVWIVSISYGFSLAKKRSIDPLQSVNAVLKKLQEASGKRAFPESVRAERDFDVPNHIDIYNKILTYHGCCSDVNLFFFDSRVTIPDERICDYRFGTRGPAPVRDKVSTDVWRCSYNTGDYIYAGFLDHAHTIYAETVWVPVSVPGSERTPVFFTYYR